MDTAAVSASVCFNSFTVNHVTISSAERSVLSPSACLCARRAAGGSSSVQNNIQILLRAAGIHHSDRPDCILSPDPHTLDLWDQDWLTEHNGGSGSSSIDLSIIFSFNRHLTLKDFFFFFLPFYGQNN